MDTEVRARMEGDTRVFAPRRFTASGRSFLTRPAAKSDSGTNAIRGEPCASVPMASVIDGFAGSRNAAPVVTPRRPRDRPRAHAPPRPTCPGESRGRRAARSLRCRPPRRLPPGSCAASVRVGRFDEASDIETRRPLDASKRLLAPARREQSALVGSLINPFGEPGRVAVCDAEPVPTR